MSNKIESIHFDWPLSHGHHFEPMNENVCYGNEAQIVSDIGLCYKNTNTHTRKTQSPGCLEPKTTIYQMVSNLPITQLASIPIFYVNNTQIGTPANI